MEFGFDFDDDDFTEKIREKQIHASYNAKICYPEWFLSDEAESEDNDRATLFKFRGDYYYHKKDVKTAIECYKTCLDNLGPSNRTMRREMIESLIRCYVEIGDFLSAQLYLEQVMKDGLTIENYCQALMLLQHLHRKSNSLKDEVLVLHQLISVHPCNAQFWLQLTEAYETIWNTITATNADSPYNACDIEHDTDLNTGVLEQQNCCACRENHTKLSDIENNIAKMDLHLHGDTKNVQSHGCAETKKGQTNEVHRLAEHKNTSCTQHVEDNVSDHKDSVHSMSENQQDARETERTCACSCSAVKHTATATVRKDSSSCTVLGQFAEILTGYPLHLVLLTCYVRTRLVFVSVQATVDSFIKERNIQIVEKMDNKIKAMTVDEKMLEAVTQFVCRDLYEEDSKEVGKQEQSQDVKVYIEKKVLPEEFNNKWFSWIKEQVNMRIYEGTIASYCDQTDLLCMNKTIFVQ